MVKQTPAPKPATEGHASTVGGLEVRSINYVPLAERHGKVWHLWPIWFTGDAHLATIAVGVLGISLGSNLIWTAIAIVASPGDEGVAAAVAVPRRRQLGQAPVAVAGVGPAHHREQTIVERLELPIDRLTLAAPEMIGRAEPAPGRLSLVDETQARDQ